MQARLKLKPGQNGTKKHLARYGERLVCVRYRYDVELPRFSGHMSAWVTSGYPQARARALHTPPSARACG